MVTVPSAGTPNWDVPLNAALNDLQGQISTIARNWAIATDKAYGAKGDGTTDDTAAIQAAVNALGSQGGVVYLPPGNYLLNSNPVNLGAPVTIQGAGHGATSIRIGSGFTGGSAFTVSSDDCMLAGLQLRGNSSTTTSNPACHGVTATGVLEFRVFNCTFQYINGYALRLFGTSTNTLHGGQLSTVKIQSCAGAIHIKSDPANLAANVEMNNVFTRYLGVNSGSNANLDGIRIEDSWDVLCQNVFAWMNATTGGTGAAFRVTGNCAAIFVQNLDALGPQTGTANVIVESGSNGDPQNVQIQGGVIQQGGIGLLISGASNQVRVRNVRILNNQTHNVSVTSTGFGIYLDECLISQGGQSASGTNYDVNWTGSAEGFITDCRFGSPIVATGSAGVQQTINVAAGQSLRVLGANFTGSGSSSSNWFTNLPAGVLEASNGTLNFASTVTLSNSSAAIVKGSLSAQPSASTSTVLSGNVGGSQTFDNFRLTGDGKIAAGTGSASRDTSWGRIAAAQFGSADSDIVAALAGKGFRIKEGTNAKMGTATLSGGSVTVSNTSVTSTSRIIAFSQADGGTPGWLRCSARTAGTSFTITSSSASDTSTIMWILFETA
jgi:hypothetical protein